MTETRPRQQQAQEESLPAQYINYVFFELDPLWRRLPDEERERGKQEFLRGRGGALWRDALAHVLAHGSTS